MKTTITIYVDALVNQHAIDQRLNKSAICNEALSLAVSRKSDFEEGSTETALRNFLCSKLEKLKDEKTLKIARRKKAMPIFHKVIKTFCEKWAVSVEEAVAIAEGRSRKEAPPAPPEENAEQT